MTPVKAGTLPAAVGLGRLPGWCHATNIYQSVLADRPSIIQTTNQPTSQPIKHAAHYKKLVDTHTLYGLVTPPVLLGKGNCWVCHALPCIAILCYHAIRCCKDSICRAWHSQQQGGCSPEPTQGLQQASLASARVSQHSAVIHALCNCTADPSKAADPATKASRTATLSSTCCHHMTTRHLMCVASAHFAAALGSCTAAPEK